MPNFEIRNIDAVNGKQKFYKLIKDGTCQIDDFENDLEEAYKTELKTIYAYMDQVANMKPLPQTKFHFYNKANQANDTTIFRRIKKEYIESTKG